MGTNAKGVIVGRRSLHEVVAALRENYGPVEIDVTRSDDFLLGRLFVQDKSTTDRRLIHVFDLSESDDDKAVHQGPRTSVTLGSSGDALAIVKAMVAPFGGYVTALDVNDKWEVVAPVGEPSLTPRERAALELSSSLGVGKGMEVLDVMDDPDRAQATLRVLQDYVEATHGSAPRMR